MTGLCDLVFDFFLATLTTDRIGFRRRSISPEGAQEYVAVPARFDRFPCTLGSTLNVTAPELKAPKHVFRMPEILD
jgi:hypothetical protein